MVWIEATTITMRPLALTITIVLVALKSLSPVRGNFNISKDSALVSRHCYIHKLRTVMGSAFNPNIMTDQLDEMTEDAKRTKDITKLDKYSKPPWACITSYRWIDLGIDYYPRFIRTSYCPPIHCWFGMFTCKSKPYRMTILRRLKSNMTEPESTEDPCFVDQHQDRSLDTSRVWEFNTIVVSLCCSCTL